MMDVIRSTISAKLLLCSALIAMGLCVTARNATLLNQNKLQLIKSNNITDFTV